MYLGVGGSTGEWVNGFPTASASARLMGRASGHRSRTDPGFVKTAMYVRISAGPSTRQDVECRECYLIFCAMAVQLQFDVRVGFSVGHHGKRRAPGVVTTDKPDSSAVSRDRPDFEPCHHRLTHDRSSLLLDAALAA